MKTRLCLRFENQPPEMVKLTIERVDYDGHDDLLVKDTADVTVIRLSRHVHGKGLVFRSSVDRVRKYAKAIARLNNRQNVVNIDVSDSGYII